MRVDASSALPRPPKPHGMPGRQTVLARRSLARYR